MIGVGARIHGATGNRASFVKNNGADIARLLQRFRRRDQHAVGGAKPRRRSDGQRRGKAQSTWAGDNQHADRRNQRVREPWLGAERHPDREGPDGDDDDHGHEHSRDAVRELLYRGLGGLRPGDHRDDLREDAVAADLTDSDDRVAFERDSRSGDGTARAAVHGRGFAGDHRFVDIQRASDDLAIGGDALAGFDDHQVADLQVIDADSGLVVRVVPGVFTLVERIGVDGLCVAGTQLDQ